MTEHLIDEDWVAEHNAQFTYKVWIEVEAFDHAGNSDPDQSEYATYETNVTGIGGLTWDEAMNLARDTYEWMESHDTNHPETPCRP